MSAAKRFRADATAQRSENTLLEVNEFKKKLNDYKQILTELEHFYANAKDAIYDEFNDMRRRIQLDAEVTITEIKQNNNMDINTDEMQLTVELTNAIGKIKDQSSSMIDAIDVYEKETSAAYEKNELKMKQFARDFKTPRTISSSFVCLWQTRLVEMDFDDQKMSEAAEKLKAYQLKLNNIARNLSLFVFNNTLLELKPFEPKQELHLSSYIYIHEFLHFKKDETFNIDDVIRLSNRKTTDEYETIFKKLTNGNYLILLKSSSKRSNETHLVVFNPTLSEIETEMTIHSGKGRVRNALEVNLDRIALMNCFFHSCAQQSEYELVILNIKLEELCRKF